jgi:hypothetical protein
MRRYAEIHIALTQNKKAAATVTNYTKISAVSNRMEPHFGLRPGPVDVHLK